MARGGKREGAGRKPGAANKATQKQRKAVLESGLSPLDYMLSVMRDETNDQHERLDAAHKAAPYVHAKLAAIDHSSQDGSMSPKPGLDVARLSDDALKEVLNAAITE